MAYSQLYIKKSSFIPLAILAVISLVFFIATFIGKPQSIREVITKKSLVSYTIVNLTPNQAGNIWETETPEVGWVELMNGKKTYDERDTEGDLKKYTYHYALLKDLKENTNNYFNIYNAEGRYKATSKQIFQVKTPQNLSRSVSGKPAYGKVIEPNGKPGRDVFVLLKVERAYPLLVLTKDTGEWLVTLTPLVDVSSEKIIPDAEVKASVQITYYEEKKKYSYVTSTVGRITPMAQTVILGNNYNLLAQGDVLSASTEQSTEKKLPLTVVYPRENAIIPAGKPLIKGQGIPEHDVFVFINSHPQFSYRTKVDKEGEWKILPAQSIGPGSYIATITSQDSLMGKITIKRNFVIAKSGEQVLGNATGPATITITPTLPVITPTLPVIKPTVVPTKYVTPLPTTAVIPTNAPPTTGGSISYLVFASMAFIIVGAGLMLVF